MYSSKLYNSFQDMKTTNRPSGLHSSLSHQDSFNIHQHAAAPTFKCVTHFGDKPDKTMTGKNNFQHPKSNYKTYLWFRKMFSHCGSSVSCCENIQVKKKIISTILPLSLFLFPFFKHSAQVIQHARLLIKHLSPV